MADELVTIGSESFSAAISPLGAELQWLRDPQGRDLLWNGDPRWWTGRAPILFPIVGALAGDAYRYGGDRYTLPKHGFARRRQFALTHHQAEAVVFELQSDDQTRAAYPFDFSLHVGFALEGASLVMTGVITNLGSGPMPVSFGFHPALLWPLPYGGERSAHRIRFAHAEPAPVRRIDTAGLLRPDAIATPVAGDTLALEDGLFVEDALIFDRLESRTLRYGAPGRTELEIAFEGMPHLGIWTKPGAPYLCIEPWQGFADPQEFAEDIFHKPGMLRLEGGQTHSCTMRITQVPPAG